MKGTLVLLLASLLAGPAAAGTISITISQAARVDGQNLLVDVKVGNTGDEAALSVTPILRFGDKEARGKAHASLGPNQSFEETLSIPVGTLGEGRWPYRLAVDYTDQNQYPFQALQTQSIVIGTPPPAKVAIPNLKPEDISGSGSLAVTVKNVSPEPRAAKVSVLVPEGLEATDPVRDVTLAGWEEAVLDVPVTNRSALVGSRYPVFVAVEYDDGPVHQAVVSQGIMAVTSAGSFLDRWGQSLWIGAGALVGVWLFLMGVRALRRPTTARS